MDLLTDRDSFLCSWYLLPNNILCEYIQVWKVLWTRPWLLWREKNEMLWCLLGLLDNRACHWACRGWCIGWQSEDKWLRVFDWVQSLLHCGCSFGIMHSPTKQTEKESYSYKVKCRVPTWVDSLWRHSTIADGYRSELSCSFDHSMLPIFAKWSRPISLYTCRPIHWTYKKYLILLTYPFLASNHSCFGRCNVALCMHVLMI